jgi:hypothetical protein
MLKSQVFELVQSQILQPLVPVVIEYLFLCDVRSFDRVVEYLSRLDDRVLICFRWRGSLWYDLETNQQLEDEYLHPQGWSSLPDTLSYEMKCLDHSISIRPNHTVIAIHGKKQKVAGYVLNAFYWNSHVLILEDSHISMVSLSDQKRKELMPFRGSWYSWCVWNDLVITQGEEECTLDCYDLLTGQTFTERIESDFLLAHPRFCLTLLVHQTRLYISCGKEVHVHGVS